MIKFDKVYIISYIHNIEKRKIINEKLLSIGIFDFEFIYGPDLYNLSNFKDINYKGTEDPNDRNSYYIHALSCTLGHLMAVQLGYDLGVNSILIMEDDILFYKDKEFIIDCLSNYPKDADIIQFGYIDFSDEKFVNTFNKTYYRPGAQMFGLCNRAAMKRYIDSQYNIFCSADNIDIFKHENDYKIKNNIYLVYPQLSIDPYHHKYMLNVESYEQYK